MWVSILSSSIVCNPQIFIFWFSMKTCFSNEACFGVFFNHTYDSITTTSTSSRFRRFEPERTHTQSHTKEKSSRILPIAFYYCLSYLSCLFTSCKLAAAGIRLQTCVFLFELQGYSSSVFLIFKILKFPICLILRFVWWWSFAFENF